MVMVIRHGRFEMRRAMVLLREGRCRMPKSGETAVMIIETPGNTSDVEKWVNLLFSWPSVPRSREKPSPRTEFSEEHGIGFAFHSLLLSDTPELHGKPSLSFSSARPHQSLWELANPGLSPLNTRACESFESIRRWQKLYVGSIRISAIGR